MTGGRGAAIRSGQRVIAVFSPENLQTASRETIVSGGFEERGKRERQRAD